jgi:hypothetical protein
MTKHLRVTLAAVVALTWCIGISTAQADEWNRETILKIDQPMLVPGATMVAGTYTFVLADDNGARNLVYIFRNDMNGTRTLVTSSPIVRMKRENDRRNLALAVAVQGEGAVPVMKGWFYPGAVDGFEFLYPDSQARLIARAETVEVPVAPLG